MTICDDGVIMPLLAIMFTSHTWHKPPGSTSVMMHYVCVNMFFIGHVRLHICHISFIRCFYVAIYVILICVACFCVLHISGLYDILFKMYTLPFATTVLCELSHSYSCVELLIVCHNNYSLCCYLCPFGE